MSAPHSAHAGANVDAWPLARGTRRCTGYRQRPSRPFEEPEQTIGNEPGSRRIYVAVALRMLAMCKEPLGHDQMQGVLCAGHRDVKQSTFLFELHRCSGAQV